ncbi:MAG TPA: hypothetical protein PK370_02675, partial [Candidatus Woesebacteria bacterium]|nr:hypothetical protein [Candidatus Woesebacteria bacterium]
MKTKILLSIIAILFVTILCFLYLRFQKPVVSNIDTKPTPSISSQSADPTSNWKTLKNTERNYEIKYPKNWYITEDNVKNFGLYISNKPITQINGYPEPTDGQIIVQVLYTASAFENGLDKIEYLSENGKEIVSDTKYIDDSNSFGVIFKYQKSNPNNNELLTTASEILSSLWVNYHNEKYGISFMHPVYYEIKEVDEGNMYYANSIWVYDTKHLVSDWADESGNTLIPQEKYKISTVSDFEQICPKDRCRSEEIKYINRGGNKFTRVFGEIAGYNFYSSKGIYLFSFEDENDPITSKILSSFSFFDSPVKILSPDINYNYLSSPIHITGKINKTWVFEGTFPIKLLDNNGQV